MKYLIILLLLGVGHGQVHSTNQTSGSDIQHVGGDSQVTIDNHIMLDNRVDNGDIVYQRPGSASKIYRKYRRPVNSAATVVSQECADSVSAQGFNFGFGMSADSQLCAYWKAADRAYKAYIEAVGQCDSMQCEVNCDKELGYVEATMKVCPVIQDDMTQADIHYKRYQDNLTAAQQLIDDNKLGARVSRFVQTWVRPVALLLVFKFI